MRPGNGTAYSKFKFRKNYEWPPEKSNNKEYQKILH
jgi:hypothetical protein